ncbi:MAG: GerAB/ArcD/ProY family transporter [Ruminiclostridium sp.]|nr:GerAB/ArcD/ProY family transporter [Ruminiclostridium sp.]
MQRFTVILLSFLLTGVVYIPLILFLKRSDGLSPAEVIPGKSKALSAFTGTVLSAYLLICAAETGLRSHYYASETVFGYAPSVYFYIIAGAALLFAVYKGTEACSRTALLTFGVLAVLLLLILTALLPELHTDRLYPSFTDDVPALWTQVLNEFSLNSEYVLFALLCGRISGRKTAAVPVYLGVSCFLTLFMTFMYNTVFGRLVSRLELPFYTLSSVSDLTFLHRINGIDAAVWLMAGILRTAFFAFAFGETVQRFFYAKRAFLPASLIFSAVSLSLSGLFTAYPDRYDPINRLCSSGIPLAFTAILLTAAAFLSRKPERSEVKP